MKRWFWILATAVVGLMTAAPAALAQTSNACTKLGERLKRQDRLDARYRCNLIHGKAWERRTRSALTRCRRSERQRLMALVTVRADALERCIADHDVKRPQVATREALPAPIRGSTLRDGNAVQQQRPKLPELKDRRAANQRLKELLAASPKPKRRPGDNAGPIVRDRQFRSGLVWSYGGKIEGMHCVQWLEPADPHDWFDNYLCTERDVGFQWSFRGPILGRGLKCIQVREKSDPHDWHDNYFCWPRDLEVAFRFSASGRLPGYRCVAIVEPSDPHTWADNYLCYRDEAG